MKTTIGVLIGEPHTASREAGIPIVEHAILRQWSSEQAAMPCDFLSKPKELPDRAKIFRQLGCDTAEMPIALTRRGWVNAESIHETKDLPDEILIVQDAALFLEQREHGEIVLNENVFAADTGQVPVIQATSSPVWVEWPINELPTLDPPMPLSMWSKIWAFYSLTLEGAVIEAVAKAWNTSLVDVLRASQFSDDDKSIKREVGYRDGKPIEMTVDVIRRPQTKTSSRSKSP